MAEKRMFAKTVIDSDQFLDMNMSARLLYYDLGMRADDDGFITPKKVMRMTGASADDLKVLIAKGFIIPFQSGVIVIRHWWLNNYIQKDRYRPTIYEEEMKQLFVDKENNKEYAFLEDVNNMDTDCIQDVSRMYPQIRLDKNRIDKEEKEKKEESKITDTYVMDELEKRFPDNPEIETAFESVMGFVEMRRKAGSKAKLTARALTLNLNLAFKASDGDIHTFAEIFDQSVARGWTGVFPLKADTGSASKDHSGTFKVTNVEEA